MSNYIFREGALPPFDHQRAYIEEDASKIRFATFWEQGTGKTRADLDRMGLFYRERVANGALVLSMSGVHEAWGEDVQEFVPQDVLERTRFHAYRTSSSRTKWHTDACKDLLTHKGLAILSMSYDSYMTDIGFSLAKEFLKKRKATWTLDESGRIKTPSSKRSKRIHLTSKLALARRILDGTPVANSPFHVYSPVRFLDKGFWKSKGINNFATFKAYFGVWEKGYNAAQGREFDKLVRYRHMDELQDILNEIGSRVLKCEALDLPPQIYHVPLTFDMTAEQRRGYASFEEELEILFDDGASSTAEIVLVKILRMREIASGFLRTTEGDIRRFKKNPRLDMLKELVQEIPGQGIIWANYTPEIDDICKILGTSAARYDGTLNDVGKTENKRAFKAGEKQWFVTTYKAACRGHNLTEATSVIYYSDNWDNEERMQSEDRAHRAGQHNPVDYYVLEARKSIDQRIKEIRESKLSMAQFLHNDHHTNKIHR